MPRFPKKEAEIAALAERLWRGLLDNIATAIETDLSACGHAQAGSTLVDQPKGKELESARRIGGAINLVPENPLSWFCSRGKSGVGSPSNTVMVVL